jgi:hypothetical protein
MGSLLCISAVLAPWLASCFFAALFVFLVLAIIAMLLGGTRGLCDPGEACPGACVADPRPPLRRTEHCRGEVDLPRQCLSEPDWWPGEVEHGG